jgi:hypothetical protein
MPRKEDLPNISKDTLSGDRSEEQSVEIKRFTPEAQEVLEKQGYVIYGLNGESIKSLLDDRSPKSLTRRDWNAKKPFYSTWHNNSPEFEAISSMQSEVAINPTEIFLPDSNIKSLKEQEILVDRFSIELAKKVPGASAIIGQASDYAAVVFQHLDATQEHLY